MGTISDYRALGLPWFRKEDYPAALAIFEDSGDLTSAWEKWEKSAKEVEDDFKAKGLIVERVYIDPETFPDWCQSKGLAVNSDAMTKFALAVTFEKYGRNQS